MGEVASGTKVFSSFKQTSFVWLRSFGTMKLPIALFLLIGLGACSSDSSNQESDQPAAEAPKTASLVFLDKSLSTNSNQAFVNEKYRKNLSELIQENIQRKGDRLEVYFVHENTSKAKALELVSQAELEDVEGSNQTDREAAQTAYDLALQKEKARFQQQALAQLNTSNPSVSNRYTDLQASLPVIDELAGEGYDVRVYYFSDMVESMPGPNRRDFHQTPPTDDEQAVTWATADAGRLRNNLSNLGKVTIRLVLPFEPTSSSARNNPAVTTYWQTLFRELGVNQSVKELY
jgi:hypothetical protein